MTARTYSRSLGEITDEQFQRALDAFDLGRLVGAEPVGQGLFGQNVFLTSTRGQFVLRGKPHYPWQFPNERLFVDLLHAHTRVPVPHPYLLCDDRSIFGWEFVLMPRLPGRNLSDDPSEDAFPEDERREIAVAQGRTLAEAQRLTHPFCGRFDLEANAILPHEPDWATWFARGTLAHLERAATYNAKTPPGDLAWARDLVAGALAALDPFTPTFSMQDYKPTNMVIGRVEGRWQVTGLFDLMEAGFGHPEADLARMWAVYVECGRGDLAYTFLNAYLPETARVDRLVRRWPLFTLRERSLVWEYIQRTGNGWWDERWTFREWAERYLLIDGERVRPGRAEDA
jgi:hygromycin-B 7''-O-kinase